MRAIFLTGGTGVVGNAIARALLATAGTRLALLLRGRSDQEVQERLQTLLRFWKLPLGEVSDRVDALRGDASLPRFGLDPSRFQRVAAECSRIIHCAALVRMNLSLADARASAVSAAENVLELAGASRRFGRLEKVEFLS